MPPLLVMVRAKFDGRGFFVTERSPELPEPSQDPALLPYLNLLSMLGWNGVRGRVDGWDVILSMEQQPDIPYKTGSTYMMAMLDQSSCPDGLTTTATQQAQLLHPLQATGEQDGWKVLIGPKQYAVDGFKTVSIWVKTVLLS